MLNFSCGKKKKIINQYSKFVDAAAYLKIGFNMLEKNCKKNLNSNRRIHILTSLICSSPPDRLSKESKGFA